MNSNTNTLKEPLIPLTIYQEERKSKKEMDLCFFVIVFVSIHYMLKFSNGGGVRKINKFRVLAAISTTHECL